MKVLERLNRGDRLLLDGGMGSEIRKRSTTGNLQSVNVDDPDLVRAIHEDYLNAGADIITTNTFSSGRVVLERMSPGATMENHNSLAAKIAMEERRRLKPEAYVAGSMSIPRGKQREGTPGSEETWRDYSAQSKALANAGVDLLLYEFIGYSADCVAAASAGNETGLPVFLGIRWVTQDARMESGETMAELIEALEGLRVDGILPMCCNPTDASATLPRLSKVFDGVIGTYPRIGDKTGEYTPEKFADHGRDWIQANAQIIGGCCNTTPAHIEALDPLVHG